MGLKCAYVESIYLNIEDEIKTKMDFKSKRKVRSNAQLDMVNEVRYEIDIYIINNYNQVIQDYET